jgi:hypothetical protein
MVQFDYDIDDFMSDCQLRNLRPKTMQSYEQSLRIFKWYMHNGSPEHCKFIMPLHPQTLTISLLKCYNKL